MQSIIGDPIIFYTDLDRASSGDRRLLGIKFLSDESVYREVDMDAVLEHLYSKLKFQKIGTVRKLKRNIF